MSVVTPDWTILVRLRPKGALIKLELFMSIGVSRVNDLTRLDIVLT